MNTNAPTRPTKTRTLSRTKKACFGAVVTLVALLAIELTLTLAGVARSTDHTDPFVGFSNQVPLFASFSNDAGQAWFRTAENKLVWFNDQRFPAIKPANTKRIFCLGGSTTFGRPYDDNTSFAGWLREWLPHVDASTRYEVINAGGVSYASYRVAAVMEELAIHQPDLFIVYTGQNEFLERVTYHDFFEQSETQLWLTGWLSKTRIYGLIDSIVHHGDQKNNSANPETSVLPAEVDERLNHTVGPSDYVRDDAWRNDVQKHFQFNLQRMVKIARSVSAKVLFVVPASNEKDCSPFKADVGANDFELGRQAFETADFATAKTAFQTALDQDVCPLRAPTEFVQFIRDFPESDDVRVFDFETRLRNVCLTEYGHDILGDEYFLDHVHPTIDTHRQLSLWLLTELNDAGWLTDSSIAIDELSPETIAAVDASVLGRIDRQAQGIAMRNLAKVMHWAGKFEVAEPRARDAIEMLGGDPESQFILADCLRWSGRPEDALREYELGVKTYPTYFRGAQRYGQWLLEMGDNESARDLLMIATLGWPESNPRHWSARYQLAIAQLRAGDFESSQRELKRCREHDPDDMNVAFALAEATIGVGDTAAAIELYEQVLQAFPNDIATYVNLGNVHLSQMRTDEASKHFAAALLLDPDNPRARAGIEVILQLTNSAKNR